MKGIYLYLISNTDKAQHVFDKLKVQSQNMLIQTNPSSLYQ